MKLLAALVALVMMMMSAGIGLAAPLPREMIVKYTTKEGFEKRFYR